eukprot:8032820-Pyramimonas_sp.AAC.1
MIPIAMIVRTLSCTETRHCYSASGRALSAFWSFLRVRGWSWRRPLAICRPSERSFRRCLAV